MYSPSKLSPRIFYNDFFPDNLNMVLLWNNPIGLCLFLHLLAGFKSQIKFKTKFNSVPITEPKKISSSSLSFDDQAEVFRSVFFQKRKPRLSLFKSAKFPFGAEPSPATEKPEIPSSVSREQGSKKDKSDILRDISFICVIHLYL